jgi:ABC-type transporter Mla subunit MlaD
MKQKTQLRLFYAAEILIWVLIIFFSVGAIKYHFAKKQGELRAYRVFLQDVDGLIEGSSVRMMGVPVGYVKNISIVQDHVYVKFVLTDPDVVLPKGVIATVEFNGMAGSKSLELYRADDVSKASGNLIVIKKTNRLGAALSLFDDMFAKLDSIIVRCGTFSTAISNIIPQSEDNSEPASIEDAEKSVSSLNKFIEDINKQRTNFMKSIRPKKKQLPVMTEISDMEGNSNESE